MRIHWIVYASITTIAFTPRADGAAVPLCPGLTIVTAIENPAGDYESIKTIQTVTSDRHRIRYSAEVPNTDPLDPSPMFKLLVNRMVLAKDLQSGTMYEQVFTSTADELIPGTTSLGFSSTVLRSLKTKGSASIRISNAYAGAPLSGDPNQKPNAYDYMVDLSLRRVGAVTLPVLVNGRQQQLPAIQVAGESDEEKSEFFLLDDDSNPLMLKMRLGIGTVKPLDKDQMEFCATMKAAVGSDPEGIAMMQRYGCNRTSAADRDVLRVIKITYRCSGELKATAGGGAGTGSGPAGDAASTELSLEQELERSRRADIYSIYFSFNSDVIREESEPTLKEIATVMKKHPDWSLSVNGHTDSIGGDQANLVLSQRRSAAVKAALVKRYGIEPNRLTTSGFGKSQPKDTNATLEGRARNRRVELIRM